jgi:hypothetical protein
MRGTPFLKKCFPKNFFPEILCFKKWTSPKNFSRNFVTEKYCLYLCNSKIIKIMDKNTKKEILNEFIEGECKNCPVYFVCGEEVTTCPDFEKFLKEKGYESIWQFVRS